MEKEKENLKDFVFTTQIAYTVYPDLKPQSVSNKLLRMKEKLKKPKGAVLLASEVCELQGITLKQLYNII